MTCTCTCRHLATTKQAPNAELARMCSIKGEWPGQHGSKIANCAQKWQPFLRTVYPRVDLNGFKKEESALHFLTSTLERRQSICQAS